MKFKRLITVLAIALICVFCINTYEEVKADEYPAYAEKGSYGTVKAALRVRKGPATSYKKIALIKAGTVVYISGPITKTEDDNVWCYCDTYDGYIAINWLTDIYYAPSMSGEDNTATDDIAKAITGGMTGIGDAISDQDINLDSLNEMSDEEFIAFMEIFRNNVVIPDSSKKKVLSDTVVFDKLARRALDIVKNRLEGQFFTANGKDCVSGSFAKSHGCSNCSATSIIGGNKNVTCSWYSVKFPEVAQYNKANHFPYCAVSKPGATKKKSASGQSCFGFGSWCCWYTYTIVLGEQNLTGRPFYAEGSFSHDFFVKYAVRAGDVIRRNGSHTVVVYSWDESGVWILDCNGHQDGTKNCVVDFRKIGYDNISIYLSRPETIVADYPSSTSEDKSVWNDNSVIGRTDVQNKTDQTQENTVADNTGSDGNDDGNNQNPFMNTGDLVCKDDRLANGNSSDVEAYINSLEVKSYVNNGDIDLDKLFVSGYLRTQFKAVFDDNPLGSHFEGKRYFPRYNYDGSIKKERYYSSKECFAWAANISSKVFKMDCHGRDKNSDMVLKNKKIDETTISKSSFETNGVKPGSVIRTSGHSVVVLGYTTDKVVITDANSSQVDGYCTVRIAVYTWDGLRKYLGYKGRKINRIVTRKDYDTYVGIT